MPFLETLKSIAETVTGIGRPGKLAKDLRRKSARPKAYRFKANKTVPNNVLLPVLHYRSAILLDERFDPAAIFEDVFALNGWKQSWRDGVYPYRHFHTGTHEVLGFARGKATLELGGAAGKRIAVSAGDVLVLPAGTSHKRVSASKDLLVVGAYPPGGDYDEPRAGEIDVETASEKIRKVREPSKDPVFGSRGQLKMLWQGRARRSKSRSG